MNFVVIGVKKSEGVFNDKPYSNYVFYFADKDDKSLLNGVIPYSRGSKVLSYKCKTDEWNNDLNPKDYVHQNVKLQFDAYGNVAQMDLV